jgi:hypothetical protein
MVFPQTRPSKRVGKLANLAGDAKAGRTGYPVEAISFQRRWLDSTAYEASNLRHRSERAVVKAWQGLVQEFGDAIQLVASDAQL